jgi:hypothetical protein
MTHAIASVAAIIINITLHLLPPLLPEHDHLQSVLLHATDNQPML